MIILKKLLCFLVIILFSIPMALCEHDAWDCPECGRTGNTGKFCGGCGHPAPTNDEGSSERTGKKNPEVGDIITFGTYPQTSEGSDQTPIEWIVLDVQDGKALLLSKYGLDAKPYNADYIDITWEKCTLRYWLNNDFLRKAFSDKEQSEILLTDVDNSAKQGFDVWKSSGGNNTKDRFFLLSYAEANKYLEVTYNNNNNKKSRVAPTAYAKTKGADSNSFYRTDDDTAAGWWWLRSSGAGNNQSNAACVYNSGTLRDHNVSNNRGIVRPALWVELESEIF